VSENKGFDGDGFYRALKTVVKERSNTWREVSARTGINPSTLSRMKRGRSPDAASLAALSAWSGLNLSDFVSAPYAKPCREALYKVSSLRRADPNPDADQYTPAFKRQMVDLVRSGRTPASLSMEFGPTAWSIRRWVKQAKRDAGKGDGGLTTPEREELSRLRRENRKLKEDREILSKGAAWLSAMALPDASPTNPIEGINTAFRRRLPKA